jgi:YVTN family beta-propeller protein
LALATLIAVPAAEAAPFAYVANQSTNNVSVIDTTDNKVVGQPIMLSPPAQHTRPHSLG